MANFYADLHIHIGSALGRVVKVTASRDLTLKNIIELVPREKGLDLVGVVDCSSNGVQTEIKELLQTGKLKPISGGGLSTGQLTLILGAEMELTIPGRGGAHFLAYFPDLDSIQGFCSRYQKSVTNSYLSTQRSELDPKEALELTEKYGGIMVPAHAFTPHKGVLGCCARRLSEVFGERVGKVSAIELGLSADSMMADSLSELATFTYLTSSDAHSLSKIAREYMELEIEEASFASLALALEGSDKKNLIRKNFGLSPLLGKYHRSYCPKCQRIFDLEVPVFECPDCSSQTLVKGVWDRLTEIRDQTSSPPPGRPPYIYQIPLQLIPGLGPKTRRALIREVGPEMYILNEATERDLIQVAGTKIANSILKARLGELPIIPGGGGRYGKVKLS